MSDVSEGPFPYKLTGRTYIKTIYLASLRWTFIPCVKTGYWLSLRKQDVFVCTAAHTSHLLQSIDVGCLGPFKKYYNAECSQWMRCHLSQVITRYDNEIACKAYIKAMTPSNIMSAFRKTRVYQITKAIIPDEKLYTCKPCRERNPLEKVIQIKSGREEVKIFLNWKIEEMQLEKNTHNYWTEETINNNENIKKPSPGGHVINKTIFKLKLMLMMKRKTEKMAWNVKAKQTDIKLKICVWEEPEPSTSRTVAKKTTQEESESNYDCE